MSHLKTYTVILLLLTCVITFAYFVFRIDTNTPLERIENNLQTVTGLPYTPENFTTPSDEELRRKLSDTQYKVTQEDATEIPYRNEYVDEKRDGIYVDIVSGEPLFSSTDKYDSQTGWPSFTKPILNDNIVLLDDTELTTTRTEVRSTIADSHLGHVFSDGPQPLGNRWCINSASLLFIPKEELEAKGYVDFMYLFKMTE